MNTLFTHNKSRTRAEKCLITLLIDVSGSMNEKNSNGNSRLDLIKESLEILLADEQSPKYSAKSSLLAISNFRIAGELAIGLFSSFTKVMRMVHPLRPKRKVSACAVNDLPRPGAR